MNRYPVFIFILVILNSPILLAGSDYFKIRVIDQETGRGVPMVELKTLNHIRYHTDSNGIIAFLEPGLMNRIIYFDIYSPGYEYPRPNDFFGSRGLRLYTAPGDSALVFIKRNNIAERLYRVTGSGIYRDSHLLGIRAPIKNHLLDGDVLGQDSVLGTIYRGKLFWIWGDTFKPSHPFGNISVSAATSELPKNGGLDPGIGIDLDYFIDSTGFSKRMIEIPGPGYVWFDWVMPVGDETGKEILIAKYARVNTLFENYERGLAIFDDETESFKKFKQMDEWLPEYHSCHHPFLVKVKSDYYYYFTSEFRFTRIKPNLEDISNPAAYESFTCLVKGEKYDKDHPELAYDSEAKLGWSWKQNTDPVDINMQKMLIDSGKIRQDEGWIQLRDIETGKRIITKRNSIYWNEYRQRWIMIAGKMVGDVWYSEADTPVGPWVYAKKIAQHDMLFYNPTQHPYFDQDSGRVIYFEGTYSHTFSGNPDVIPRYEYNQLMYRLSLDNQQVFLPVPVYLVELDRNNFDYQLREEVASHDNWDKIEKIAFFAFQPGREITGLIPIYKKSDKTGISLITEKSGRLLCYALPAEKNLQKAIIGTWQCISRTTDPGFHETDFKLTISLQKNQFTGKIADLNVKVTHISIRDSSIAITLKAEDRDYYLNGIIENGMIAGKWRARDQSEHGTWEATPTDGIMRISHSSSVVSLYRYSDSRSSNKFYSTSHDAMMKTYHRSERPICSVWQNPYSLLILDYEAKAVPLQK